MSLWGAGERERGQAGEAKLGCGGPLPCAQGTRGAHASLCTHRAVFRIQSSGWLGRPGAYGGDSPAGSCVGHPAPGLCSPREPLGRHAAPGARQEGDVTAAECNSNQMGLHWRPGLRGGHRQEPAKGCGRKRPGGTPTGLTASGLAAAPGAGGHWPTPALAWASHPMRAEAQAVRTPLPIHPSIHLSIHPFLPLPPARWGAQIWSQGAETGPLPPAP